MDADIVANAVTFTNDGRAEFVHLPVNFATSQLVRHRCAILLKAHCVIRLSQGPAIRQGTRRVKLEPQGAGSADALRVRVRFVRSVRQRRTLCALPLLETG